MSMDGSKIAHLRGMIVANQSKQAITPQKGAAWPDHPDSDRQYRSPGLFFKERAENFLHQRDLCLCLVKSLHHPRNIATRASHSLQASTEMIACVLASTAFTVPSSPINGAAIVGAVAGVSSAALAGASASSAMTDLSLSLLNICSG